MEIKPTPFIGHVPQVEKLKAIMADPKNYSRSCFLYVGPPGNGKRQVAKWFADCVSHPMDVTEFTYDGQQSQDDFTQLFYSMNYGARKNSVKTYIIDLTKPLSLILSNALLKSLEEVKNNTCIILIAPDESYLITTIASRARCIDFDGLTPYEVETVLTTQMGFTSEQSGVLRQCFGNNLELAQCMSYEEIVEARDYIYQYIQDMSSPYAFIEIMELAYWMAQPQLFKPYLSIILNWSQGFILDPTWGPKFSALCANLLKIRPDEQNLDLWIQRAFLKYVGWKLPKIETPYETVE